MKQQKDIYVPLYYICAGRQTTSDGEKACLHFGIRFALTLRYLFKLKSKLGQESWYFPRKLAG